MRRRTGLISAHCTAFVSLSFATLAPPTRSAISNTAMHRSTAGKRGIFHLKFIVIRNRIIL
ncbi:hypothetical protein CIPAW_05G138100 [Carya illinoinensis]|uniref:Secreted protein n=1 Tax=Carya illinoinensis TaxID=32201 RepID=A0A8T1QJI2_CARIL|nr:hypothetical protein CIPAW_05G138100 [Carya illinoinensis]